MKVGFNLLLWTTHVEEEHYPILEKLARLGYDGVEVPVMRGKVRHYRHLAAVLRELGLGCTCSTALPGPEADPLSDDFPVRRAAGDYLRWCIDCVDALGARLLCGPLYQALGRFTGEGPTETEWERAVEHHRAAADHAATADITLAIEPLNRFECYFLNTVADAASHVRAVDRPNFGIHYDTFHANIEEKDPVWALDRHLEYVRHIHLSENDRGIPGQGHVDFPATLETVRESDYAGWLVVEAFGRSLPDLAAATRVWRDLFPSADEVPAAALGMIRRYVDAERGESRREARSP